MHLQTIARLRILFILFALAVFGFSPPTSAKDTNDTKAPLVDESVHFVEKDGLVAVEAEHFFKQTLTDVRAFHLTHKDQTPKFEMDGDPAHVGGASNGAYLEILPDTRRNHGEKLTGGVNFSNIPGKLAILHYKVKIENPGRYYVWVRAHSTGSEDNGLHVGINGAWPETGQRLQWCEGKRQWWWESKQRTEKAHCGVPHKIYLDIEKPGEHTIHFSMREDGFEFDKWLMTKDINFKRPANSGPSSPSNTKTIPTFPLVEAPPLPAVPEPVADPAPKAQQKSHAKPQGGLILKAADCEIAGTNFYIDQAKWLAVNPEAHKSGTVQQKFTYPTGVYNVILRTVGENDGQSTYAVSIGDRELGTFKPPLSKEMYETGAKYNNKWSEIKINNGETISVTANVGSADGKEFSRARWQAIVFRPADAATKDAVAILEKLAASKGTKEPSQDADNRDRSTSPTKPVSSADLVAPRRPNGDGSIRFQGEFKTWHKVSLIMNGPYAHEQDNKPNPFLDYRMETTFTHSDGTTYTVPGFFAADGSARDSSAESGTNWQTNFAPDRPGDWRYECTIVGGEKCAINATAKTKPLFETRGTIEITPTNKSGKDFRGKGRLQYVGKHYLQHAGSKSFFLKAGADAPETLLGYADFDGTVARKKNVPLKKFEPHIQDWTSGDPTWKSGKGKGLIGAVNYLSGKGCNAFSFLTYNAGGDGDNVWPFIDRDDKLHYDCSKLDQWGTVFDHATAKGMYLHFKLQETENDDHRGGKKGNWIPTSLDGGNLGDQRKLYIREIVARFGHNLALNWNLGEENTQSTEQQIAMINFIRATDPYGHHVVVHSYPDQQERVYNALKGDKSTLTGASLQNSGIQNTHVDTVKWVRASAATGKPWVVAFDESGTAAHGQCPDLGYKGFDGKDKTGKYIYDQHAVRRQTLWGTIMGGGAGVEYYFGYQFAENDLVCEDWRSRDQSWDYCRICLEFFETNKFPFEQMKPMDELVGNPKHDNSRYCFAKPGEVYLVYLPKGGATEIDLSDASGEFSVQWFNPRSGGELFDGPSSTLTGGSIQNLDSGKTDEEDWVAVLRKK